MKIVVIAATAALLMPAPLLAQGKGVGLNDAGGYVTGLAGFASSTANTTGDVQVEGGIRVAPHVNLFGDIGHFGDLQGDLQPTLDATTSSLAANQGGGVQIPVSRHWGTDVGYRYSRIAADEALSASPLHINGMTFGFGYRF